MDVANQNGAPCEHYCRLHAWNTPLSAADQNSILPRLLPRKPHYLRKHCKHWWQAFRLSRAPASKRAGAGFCNPSTARAAGRSHARGAQFIEEIPVGPNITFGSGLAPNNNPLDAKCFRNPRGCFHASEHSTSKSAYGDLPRLVTLCNSWLTCTTTYAQIRETGRCKHAEQHIGSLGKDIYAYMILDDALMRLTCGEIQLEKTEYSLLLQTAQHAPSLKVLLPSK